VVVVERERRRKETLERYHTGEEGKGNGNKKEMVTLELVHKRKGFSSL